VVVGAGRSTVRRGARPLRDPRSASALGFLAGLTVVATSAFVLVGLLPDTSAPSSWVAGVEPGVVPVSIVAESLEFPDDLLADIDAYRVPRRRVALVGLILSVAVPLTIAGALRRGGATRLLGWSRIVPGAALRTGCIAALVVVMTALVRLPLSVWAGVVQDGRWGFRTRPVAGWLVDHLLIVGGRALGVGALVWAVALLVRRHPVDWPARVVLLTAVVGPLALLLHPVVVHPFLLPTGPLPDGPHKEAVLAVVARADTDIPVLLGEASLRTTRRNAVVTGLGPTARVVLHDTLLTLEPQEVAAIAAHELAHVERRDPLRAALAPVPAVALLALLVRRRLRMTARADVRSLASAAVLVIALEAAMTPVSAAVTRTVEHRTDVRSVAISGDPIAHITMLRAFVTDGLADPDPPRWSVLLWSTHPAPVDRILAVSGVDLATR
jgi:STE24 endopeptidase